MIGISEIDRVAEAAMLDSGKFYRHMDQSICCVKCSRTLKEGCTHAKVSVSVCGVKIPVEK